MSIYVQFCADGTVHSLYVKAEVKTRMTEARSNEMIVTSHINDIQNLAIYTT